MKNKILKQEEKELSFVNVEQYVRILGGSASNYNGIFNVIVDGEEQYEYENVRVFTSYDNKYCDYKVIVMWEDDKDEVHYEKIGLHGKYSSNFQLFKIEDGALTFNDGAYTIYIRYAK